MKGLILDIHRNALDDGPGIRTTVFLKGCPLKCQWCHNPESISTHKTLGFFSDKCTLCGDCVRACPNIVHSIVDGVHLIDRMNCRTCGKCVEACNNEALTLSGKEMTVEEVFSIVTKDEIYYKESGGGLTVSGGEPMLQLSFTYELLRLAKSNTIHTCLDTSGLSSQENYLRILPMVDLFLFDFKLAEDDQHRKYTGVSNKLILENLDYLYRNRAKIELRCPVIPGINDTEEHFETLRQLRKKYPELKGFKIMPYHDIGRSKYERYGMQYLLMNIPSASQMQIDDWNNAIN